MSNMHPSHPRINMRLRRRRSRTSVSVLSGSFRITFGCFRLFLRLVIGIQGAIVRVSAARAGNSPGSRGAPAVFILVVMRWRCDFRSAEILRWAAPGLGRDSIMRGWHSRGMVRWWVSIVIHDCCVSMVTTFRWRITRCRCRASRCSISRGIQLIIFTRCGVSIRYRIAPCSAVWYSTGYCTIRCVRWMRRISVRRTRKMRRLRRILRIILWCDFRRCRAACVSLIITGSKRVYKIGAHFAPVCCPIWFTTQKLLRTSESKSFQWIMTLTTQTIAATASANPTQSRNWSLSHIWNALVPRDWRSQWKASKRRDWQQKVCSCKFCIDVDEYVD